MATEALFSLKSTAHAQSASASTAHEQLLSPVGEKVPFPPFDEFCFLRKSFGHLHFHDNFLENHQILSVFTKYFAKRIRDLQYSVFFFKLPYSLIMFYTYLGKTFRKTNIIEIFFEKTNIFAKIWQILMSSKYFHKNGPFLSQVADKFLPFLRN